MWQAGLAWTEHLLHCVVNKKNLKKKMKCLQSSFSTQMELHNSCMHEHVLMLLVMGDTKRYVR